MRRFRTQVERGMTLIELMVVMAIIGLMIAIGAVSLAAIRGADTDATGSILSGAMTYLSSRAVHDNRTYRLVIDMGQHRFWSETTNDDDPCARFIPEEAEPAAAEAKGDEKKVAPEDSAEEAEGGDAAFAQKKDALLQMPFRPDTNVTAVLTSHHTQPQTEGLAAIYFYPNGQAERALLWVGSKDQEAPSGWKPEITIELHSLGTVTFHGKVMNEKDFDLLAPEEVQ